MKVSQCDYCLYLAEDPETGEVYCTMNLDQDAYERLLMDKKAECNYFRMGDDYTIVKKQGE